MFTWLDSVLRRVMRPRVSWIAPVDDRILELLDRTGLTLTPKTLAYNLDFDRHYVANRLRQLEANGLVEREERGLYSIADLGEAYLEGSVDADDLEPNDS